MQVDFEVVFSGEVTSAELTIVSGKLSSLKLGPAKASVKVSCEGARLHDFSRPVALLPAYELHSAARADPGKGSPSFSRGGILRDWARVRASRRGREVENV